MINLRKCQQKIKMKRIKNETILNTNENNESNNKNNISLLNKNSNQIIDKNIDFINSDSFLFNGKTFIKYYKDNKYKNKDKISRLIFKCIYQRKNEKLRIELKKQIFVIQL